MVTKAKHKIGSNQCLSIKPILSSIDLMSNEFQLRQIQSIVTVVYFDCQKQHAMHVRVV